MEVGFGNELPGFGCIDDKVMIRVSKGVILRVFAGCHDERSIYRAMICNLTTPSQRF